MRQHCGCGCSVPLLTVQVFLGGAQNWYPLVSSCVMCYQCKVWNATICPPLEGLDCCLVYRSTDCLIKDLVELFVIISEERTSVGKLEGLLPCNRPRQSLVWAVQYKSWMGHNNPPLDRITYLSEDFLAPNAWPAFTNMESFHFASVVVFPIFGTSGTVWLILNYIAFQCIS